MNLRAVKAIFALLVCISGVLLLGHLTQDHNWGDDFAAYIMQAKSITELTPAAFVESNRFTIDQSSRPLGPTAYPWGLPLLLAPLYGIFGLNLIALKAVNVVSWLLFLFVLWFAFRGSHPGLLFLLLVSLFALNPTLLSYSNDILSDLPFLLASTFCVSLIQKLVAHDRRLISPVTDKLIIGITIAFAFFIRTNGALLLLMLAFTQVVSWLERQPFSIQLTTRDERLCGAFTRVFDFITDSSLRFKPQSLVPYFVFFFLVIISSWVMPDGGASHVSHLKGISIRSIESNLHYYFGLMSEFFSGTRNSSVIYGVTIPLAIVGAARRFRSDYPAILYVILVVLFQIIWPYQAGLRYLLPILPFYLSFALSGFESFWTGTKSLERAFRKTLCYVSILLVILSFSATSLITVYWNMKTPEVKGGPFASNSQEMFSYLVNNTAEDSVVVFFKPRVLRLMTDRQSIMIDKVEQIGRGDYLCLYLRKDAVDQVPDVEVQRLVEQKAAWIVYENDDFKVYRLGMECDNFSNNTKQSDGNSAELHLSQ
jgi:hypothetical protein